MSAPPPLPRRVRSEELGRTCPHCRFPLKADVPVTDCPKCHTTHHSDCWDETGACAAASCLRAVTTAPAPTAAKQPTAGGPEVAPPVGSPPPRRPWGLMAAIIGLAMAAGGAATAVIVVWSGGSKAPASVAQTVIVRDRPTTVTQATAPAPATHTARDKPDPAEIAQTVRSYYAAVVDGDYTTAWRLLTPSYKAWKRGNGGWSKWHLQEVHNHNHLVLDDVDVDVRSYDRASRVATIFVDGLTFRLPGGGTCDYQGVTWVRRVGARWLYDQGYLQTPARAATWRPRARETLGVPCETDGY
jgi:Prokaryotic RING finger family 1